MNRRNFLCYGSVGLMGSIAGCGLLTSSGGNAYLYFINRTDENHMVDVTIRDESDSIIFEDTYSIAPGRKLTDPIVDEGRFDVKVSLDEESTKSSSLLVGCENIAFYIRIHENESLSLAQTYCD